ncbi:dTDP-3-amino-3,6-dideoxy-alpha-D-galactopyranose transaminase [Polystyrenella longa]|uniref:dTDP-3-amino-3,6-dideoxy-alpha-D-galactopyranose transaminase n=1 Tax=Polystyrenella longa TaxID=2528007 RepID=A0A518CHW6_9PLAN|nr:DegT/DnrJ/EryC1/StrS family aminotransferase [Polystyrenella longa]QDU78816.1 dTDP-3-amino-3,6-dideoxy-alpha-D-galactopyranose transaminase [Polystyrenella longa]
MTDQHPVKQCDPHAGYHAWWVEIDAAVIETLQRDRYLMGKELRLFEQEFSQWQECEHTVGVANGTDALLLSLMALDIKPGSAVLTPSMTAVATVNAIVRSGAIPVFVDVNEETGTICPHSLEETLKRLRRRSFGLKPAAMVVVHLYGLAAEMSRLCVLSEEYSLPIIEDAAQAHGARYRDKRVGTFGKLAAFSFYPTKNLAALGDAGAVTTDDLRLAERVRALRQYGWDEQRQSHEVGVNSRLDELQATILRIKLRHINQETRRRRKIAQHYNHALLSTSIEPMEVLANSKPVYHQYVVRTPQRESLRQHLEKQQIQTAVHYPLAVHQHPVYQKRYDQLLHQKLIEPLVRTEKLAEQVLSLPMYPQLSDGEIERVTHACREWSTLRGGTEQGSTEK